MFTSGREFKNFKPKKKIETGIDKMTRQRIATSIRAIMASL